MKASELNLGLLTNSDIFEAIHETKKQFKELFIEISNKLENQKLSVIFPPNKGVKISMGNELQKCPYQVLDIFRDFDKKRGHNIRILNWWGHGLYIFVFFGKDLAAETMASQNYFNKMDFRLARGSSPWDYAGILATAPVGNIDDRNLDKHLSKFGYLLWFKEIRLEADSVKLQNKITGQLDQIFHFHRI